MNSSSLDEFLVDLEMNLSIDNLDEDQIKKLEHKILSVGEKYRDTDKHDDLSKLIKSVQRIFKQMSKVKAVKLMKQLFDMYLDMDVGIDLKIQLCQDSNAWAEQENLIFLRQILETKLIALYYDNGQYIESMNRISQLQAELKKQGDKVLLIEVSLLESKTYYSLSNIQKAKTALISTRSLANSIYVSPKMQGAIDFQAGVIYGSVKDYKTSYSYFVEAFEQFESVNDTRAISALKYMLLFKVILKQMDDVDKILSGKIGVKYDGPDVKAMKAISDATKNRSLPAFKLAMDTYQSQFKDDKNMLELLGMLYDELIEKNICKIIQPYSTIQIDYVARKIGLPRDNVEKKLSEMILNKTIHGIIDQRLEGNVVILFIKESHDETADDVIESILAMNNVIDRLYQAAKKLN